MPATFDPANPFTSLYEPLGAFVVEFASLESTLTLAIDAMMSLEHMEGVALESLMPNLNPRIELFSYLANHKSNDDEHRKYAVKISSGLKQANSDRNNLIHGRWTGHTEPGGFHKIRLKAEAGILQHKPVHSITNELIWKEVKYVVGLGQHLSSWTSLFQIKTSPPAWPIPSRDRWPQRSPLHSLFHDQNTKATARPPPPSQA